MRESILRRLYEGTLMPMEEKADRDRIREYNTRQSSRYRELIEKLREIDSLLCEDFIGFVDDQTDVVAIEIEDAFIRGFCLGVKMFLEVEMSGYSCMI